MRHESLTESNAVIELYIKKETSNLSHVIPHLQPSILKILFSKIRLNGGSIVIDTGEYSKKVKAAQQLHCLLTSSPLHLFFCSSNLAVKNLVVCTVTFNSAPPSAIAKK